MTVEPSGEHVFGNVGKVVHDEVILYGAVYVGDLVIAYSSLQYVR